MPSASDLATSTETPGCRASEATSPGHLASIASMVRRPGSRANQTRPRFPDPATTSSGRSSASLLTAARGPSETAPSSSRPLDDRARHRRGEPRLPGEVGQEDVERPPVLVVAGGRRHPVGAAHQVADGVLEGLAVALEERRPLALPVVGEHDEVVRAGRLLRDLLEHPDDLVDALHRPQRLLAGDAGVVRDLVVVEVVGVEHLGARQHLLGHQRGDEVALDHVGDAAQGDVGPVPVDAGLDVEAHLPAPLVALLEHLADRPEERAREAVRRREERAVVAASCRCPACGPCPARSSSASRPGRHR